MSQIIVKEPRFVDLQKTRMAFKIQKEDGSLLSAELKVPPNQQRGVNKYWDHILDNFDVESLRQQRNMEELRERKLKDFNQKKRRAAEENENLKRLFNVKMKVFELSFIKNSSEDVKSAVRRAPDEQFLNFIIFNEMRNYMENNNMSYVDYLDYLDDLQDELEALKNKKDTNLTTSDEKTDSEQT